MRNKKGFTLVELLVVLVIVGILVALILPATLRAINQAERRECASNIRALNTAAQMFHADNRLNVPAWPGNPAALAVGGYLSDRNNNGVPDAGDVPTCPLGGGAYTFVVNAAGGDEVNMAPHAAHQP